MKDCIGKLTEAGTRDRVERRNNMKQIQADWERSSRGGQKNRRSCWSGGACVWCHSNSIQLLIQASTQEPLNVFSHQIEHMHRRQSKCTHADTDKQMEKQAGGRRIISLHIWHIRNKICLCYTVILVWFRKILCNKKYKIQVWSSCYASSD